MGPLSQEKVSLCPGWWVRLFKRIYTVTEFLIDNFNNILFLLSFRDHSHYTQFYCLFFCSNFLSLKEGMSGKYRNRKKKYCQRQKGKTHFITFTLISKSWGLMSPWEFQDFVFRLYNVLACPFLQCICTLYLREWDYPFTYLSISRTSWALSSFCLWAHTSSFVKKKKILFYLNILKNMCKISICWAPYI